MKINDKDQFKNIKGRDLDHEKDKDPKKINIIKKIKLNWVILILLIKDLGLYR